MALGLPLLLAIATSARTLPAQAAAAAGIPIVTLCGYLTFSRGGALAAGAGLLVFLAFSPERVEKLATALVTAAGSGAVILAATHRPAIEQGLTSAAARHQGRALLVSLVMVCAGVALAQTGVGLAARHGTPPRWLTFSPRPGARASCWVPSRPASWWRCSPAPRRASPTPGGTSSIRAPQRCSQDSIARFGTASGNGRYDYWKVAVDATSGHVLGGSGAGTFQLLWTPRAPYFSYVQNAHSLYVETLAETGMVGAAAGRRFFLVVLGAAVRLSVRSRYEARVRAAGLTGALVAFCVAAASDWIWQVPALPAAFLLLAAAVLAPPRVPRDRAGARHCGCASARSSIAVAACSPSRSRWRRSAPCGRARRPWWAAIRRGRSPTRAPRCAWSQAPPRRKSSWRSCSSSRATCPRRSPPPARRRTTSRATGADGSSSRVCEAEAGHPAASLAAYRRSRSLNPRSPLFRQ